MEDNMIRYKVVVEDKDALHALDELYARIEEAKRLTMELASLCGNLEVAFHLKKEE